MATSFFGGAFFGGEFFNSGTTTPVTAARVVRGHRRMVRWCGRLYYEDDPDLLRLIAEEVVRAESKKRRKNAKKRGRVVLEIPKFEAGYVYTPAFPRLPNVSALIEQQRMIGEDLIAGLLADAARRYLKRLEEDEDEAIILLMH